MRILLVIACGGLCAATLAHAENESWIGLSKLAQERENQSNFSEAETLRRRALEAAEQQLAANDKRIASLLTNLGCVLHNESRDTEADPLLRRALVIAEESEDKILIASVLNAIGLGLYGRHELARSEPVLRRALALFEEVEGPNSLAVGKTANNLACAYADSHQYAKAEEQLSRALGIYELRLGNNDPAVAQALLNRFTILCEQKRAAEGEPYLRRALAIAERSFPNTVQMARIRTGLAAFEAQRGHYRDAAHILEEVIAIDEAMLGPSSPELGRTLTSYSAVLKQLHDKADAKRVEDRANAILKSSFH